MRLTVRKIFSLIGFLIFFFIFVINVHLRTRAEGYSNLIFFDPLSVISPPDLSPTLSTISLLKNTTSKSNGGGVDKGKRRHFSKDEFARARAKIPLPENRPWYMKNGKISPKPCAVSPETNQRIATVFPEEKKGDRITDQLMFFPPNGSVPADQGSADAPLKMILLWNGGVAWSGMRAGRGVFLKKQCPVSTCAISTNRRDGRKADLIIFKDHFVMPGIERPTHQLWMMYMLECPVHTQMFNHKDIFNWTATYRSDSTVVTPYERWEYFNDEVRALPHKKNFAENKKKQVAWFVSNCGATNGRLDYARNLSHYIGVDIYGKCGDKQCPRTNPNCFDMLKNDYKFYLAFENSNCIDYITEKFYVNGLGHNILPIVMGARPEDYKRAAPEKSYIHVEDFDTPEELAKYLHKLDQDDELYNEYFQWKGTGQMIDTNFFCRLCSLLHDNKERGEAGHVADINEWWRGRGTCINAPWKVYYRALERDKQKRLQLEREHAAKSGNGTKENIASSR